MLVVPFRVVENFGGKAALEAEVGAFAKEVEAHALTVDVPAPTSSDLVEAIVRNHGGEFVVGDPTKDEIQLDENAKSRSNDMASARSDAMKAAKNGDLAAVVNALLRVIG